MVVFCTVYAMILPAVTLGNSPLDGDGAVVTEISITDIQDGVAPFDTEVTTGNDVASDNKIVRTYLTRSPTILKYLWIPMTVKAIVKHGSSWSSSCP